MLERRYFLTDCKIETRAAGEPKKIYGHAALFNSLSQDLGGFREQIAPGAFTRAITEDDVRALFNHDANLILGRNISGTLKLMEDSRGLAFEITPPDTQAGRDIVTSIERGDISQNSFGFTTVKDSWDKVGDGVVRTLIEVKLFDVSPVVYPAYLETDVAVRSFNKFLEKCSGLDDWKHELENRRNRLRLLEA